jgi:Protein kinase domain/SPOR domain
MMGTEQATTRINWTSLSGVILDGGYELEELLEAEETRATFKTRILGDRFTEAISRFFVADKTRAEKQLSIWQGIRAIRHPNVVAPMGAGRRQVDGTDLAYVVLARGDEALSAVLQERALTVRETGDVLISLANALRHLHANGFVHGCLSPREVVAIGELIKIQSESVRYIGDWPGLSLVSPRYLAPESREENLTPAADVWCLGATILETMTQQGPTEDSKEAAVKLDLRLGYLITRCLETDPAKRCSLDEALGIYKGEVKVRPIPVPAPKPAASAPPTPTPAATPVPSPAAPASTPFTPAASSPGRGTAPAPDVQPVKKAVAAISEPPSAVAASAGVASGSVGPKPAPVESPRALAPTPVPPSKGETAGPRAMRSPAPEPIEPRPVRSREPMPPNRVKPMDAGSRQETARLTPTLVSAQSVQAGPTRPDVEESKSPLRSSRLYIVIGAIIVLVLLFWLAKPKRKVVVQGPVRTTQADRQQTGASGPSGGVAGGAAARSTNTSMNRGETAPSQTTAKAQTSAANEPAAGDALGAPATHAGPGGNPERPIWRVILYTYARQEDAQHRAEILNEKHPELTCGVFAPNGDTGPYLVIAGGSMSRDEALQVRRKALGLGMPHDSYIQNYRR